MALLKRVSRLAGTVSAAFGGSLGEPIDIMRRGSVVAAAQLGPATRHFRSSRNMASWADFLGAHGHGAEPAAEPSAHAEPAPARGVDLAPVLEAPAEEALGRDLSWVEGLTVAQLKGELRARSLKVSGRKAELQVRLWDALA